MLLGLLFIPIFVWVYLRLLGKKKQIAAELGPLGIVQNGDGKMPERSRHIPLFIILVGLTVLLFGLARPEMIIDLPHLEGTVILVMDVSTSMKADDLEPTRMEAAKAAAQAFVENQPETVKVGVVAFSNGGLVVQTPTSDSALVLDTIQRLSPQGATSLGQGIFSALNAIAGETISIDPATLEVEAAPVNIGHYPSAVMVVLTDGENTASPDPIAIAQLAASAGVRIYTVGVGSTDGTILEVDGFNVVTQLNEPILEEIASVTNGAYYYAEDEETLRDIYKNVDLRLSVSGDKMEITSVLAGISLAFFLVGGIWSLIFYGRIPV
jgi:Ca-activated chloride channel family protein